MNALLRLIHLRFFVSLLKPMADSCVCHDYYLQFQKTENAPRWVIAPGGLIENTATPLLNSDKLPLQKDLFYNDALVFKNLESSIVSIKSGKGKHGLKMDFPGFPFMGIWSAKDADFICIEPWCGIADAVNHTGELTEKEGIIKAAGNSTWQNEWQVECF